MFTRRCLALLLLVCSFGQNIAAADAASKTVSGTHGESLTASTTTPSPSGLISVHGAHFDETVGIYLAYCVVPKRGKMPTPCGGGINKSGVSAVSFWISSNPPPYGKGLAEGYLPGGRFEHTIRVSPLIGKFDCRKVKCAITVRADHTRDSDRTYDIFIPITFPKKQ